MFNNKKNITRVKGLNKKKGGVNYKSEDRIICHERIALAKEGKDGFATEPSDSETVLECKDDSPLG